MYSLWRGKINQTQTPPKTLRHISPNSIQKKCTQTDQEHQVTPVYIQGKPSQIGFVCTHTQTSCHLQPGVITSTTHADCSGAAVWWGQLLSSLPSSTLPYFMLLISVHQYS